MTDKTEDGGPAFPVPIASHASGDTVPAFDWGMSLRDWLAGQALAGMIDSFSNTNEALARNAYEVADAMLAARKEGQGGGA